MRPRDSSLLQQRVAVRVSTDLVALKRLQQLQNDTRTVTSPCRRAQDNAPAAPYWLRRVPDDGERRDWTSPPCKGCRGRSLQRTGALFQTRYRPGGGETICPRR